MKAVTARKGYVEVNGRKQFILSGEVQYFRIEKKNWRTAVKALVDANCNTLSTYVPWNWHEYEKGKYDFTGATHPSRDLKGFLELVKEYGLNLVIKGGPHIHAEFKNGGLPQWVLHDCPQLLCLDHEGKPTRSYAFYPPVTYLHPDYMKLVRQWFAKFSEVVKPYSDRIIAWQVDNEISYSLSFFHFSAGQAFTGDYNPFLIQNGLYQKFLATKYGTIGKLNARYKEKNASFSKVVPPRKEPVNRPEHFKVRDWVEFRERLVAMYLRELIEMLYGMGVKGPFSVDDPLLGYDTSWGEIYDVVKDPRWEVTIGYTYYSGSTQEEGMGQHLSRIEFTRASGCSMVSNHEMQAGGMYFLSHWKQASSDYDLLWKTCLGYGSNMMNLYWFADGYNFDGYEFFLPELDTVSPIDKNGRKRVHYKIVQQLGAFVGKNPWIVETNPVYDIGVGFYHPHARLAKFNNQMGIQSIELGRGGMIGSYIDTLGVCNINFKMLDIQNDELNNKTVPNGKLTIIGQEYLDGRIQRKLLEFARGGGHLVLFRTIPSKDEEFNDCTILRDALKISKIGVEHKGAGVFEILRLRHKDLEYCVCGDVNVYEFRDRKVTKDITMSNNGKVCGFTRGIGKGSISVVGYIPQIFMDTSRAFARAYFGKQSEDGILVYERRNKARSLFTVCNMHDEPHKVRIGGKVFTVKPRHGNFIMRKGNAYTMWK